VCHTCDGEDAIYARGIMRDKIEEKIKTLNQEAWDLSNKIQDLRNEMSNLELRLAQVTGAIQALDEILADEEKGAQ